MSEIQSDNNCKFCNDIKFQQRENTGDYREGLENGIYRTEDGNCYWFQNCEDDWYSGFVHKVNYCPFCGRKV